MEVTTDDNRRWGIIIYNNSSMDVEEIQAELTEEEAMKWLEKQTPLTGWTAGVFLMKKTVRRVS